jgi:hypothetical protein
MSTFGGQRALASTSVLFAAAMLLVLGVFNLIQGLVALFKDDVYLIGASGLVLTTDYTMWGWALFTQGVVLILAALSLFSFGGFGRWFAMAVVVATMIGQFAFLPAYPLWGVIVIGISAVVLWALTFGWREATEG